MIQGDDRGRDNDGHCPGDDASLSQRDWSEDAVRGDDAEFDHFIGDRPDRQPSMSMSTKPIWSQDALSPNHTHTE